MKLNNTNRFLNDYIHKPQRDSAPKLHQLFNKNLVPFKIPTAGDLILERLQFDKWCAIEYGNIFGDIADSDEVQEMCDLINADWEDIDETVIDEYLANKQKGIMT